ncbi:MAG: LysM peptidoglycan-binding domain-containing protein [Bacteroidia bacterium]|nr:LysM peptidoglycan-binding domain-containing protein [Bacteroidia bacterium]
MKQIKRILLFLVVISTSCLISHAQVSKSFLLHTIEKGQSLYSISNMYNVSTAEIVRLNPHCEDKIYAGQTLKIPLKKTEQSETTFHTIASGETLYKLTTIYGISAQEICEANPGLSAENFRIGQIIRIPTKSETNANESVSQPAADVPAIQGPVLSRCKEMHRVKRKETLFSISREYHITQEELIKANPELKEGVKKGQLLCIPYPKAQSQNKTDEEETTVTPPSNNELFVRHTVAPRKLSTIKAAILLPFTEDRRMVEYYEGLLIAVDSLKRLGTSIDLYAYNCTKEPKSLTHILDKEEMKQMDVIFGPVQNEHMKPLTAFAKKHKVRLVVPFSSKVSEVFNTPNVYQINTPQSYLYSEVYEHFTRQFPHAHVIFVQASRVDKEKEEFIKGLKNELKLKGISMSTANESSTADHFKTLLREDKENIFIPTSGSNITLIKVLPQLTLLVREMPEFNMHLFGYPEWQTYTKDHLESFFTLDTYFYSSFYTNNLFPAAIRFTQAYHKWYSKEMMPNSYPQYGMLGFDTGFFFLNGLSHFGSALESNLNRNAINPIQTGFKFQRVNNWGGFVNKKVFFVRFTRDYELVKLDFE